MVEKGAVTAAEQRLSTSGVQEGGWVDGIVTPGRLLDLFMGVGIPIRKLVFKVNYGATGGGEEACQLTEFNKI